MFKKLHVGVDENFGYTHSHTHTHRIAIYSFLQGLFMNEQETDKSSYHFSAMNFNLEEYIYIYIYLFIFGYFAALCTCLYVVGQADWCRGLI